MATEVLVATRSTDKLEEIRAVLSSSVRSPLRTLSDVGIAISPAEDDIENYPTFLENAVAKARYFAGLTGLPVLADDSGLMVDALGGAPGVRTKRFAIDESFVPIDTRGRALDEANNQLLLEKLGGKDDTQRAAHYVCAAAYAHNGALHTSVGTCSGIISHAEKGTGGFGYDPLFFIPALGVTFAELSRAEKNARSHRAIAFRALATQVK